MGMNRRAFLAGVGAAVIAGPAAAKSFSYFHPGIRFYQLCGDEMFIHHDDYRYNITGPYKRAEHGPFLRVLQDRTYGNFAPDGTELDPDGIGPMSEWAEYVPLYGYGSLRHSTAYRKIEDRFLVCWDDGKVTGPFKRMSSWAQCIFYEPRVLISNGPFGMIYEGKRRSAESRAEAQAHWDALTLEGLTFDDKVALLAQR